MQRIWHCHHFQSVDKVRLLSTAGASSARCFYSHNSTLSLFLTKALWRLRIIRDDMPIIHRFRRDVRRFDNTAFTTAQVSSGSDMSQVSISGGNLLLGYDIAAVQVQFMLKWHLPEKFKDSRSL